MNAGSYWRWELLPAFGVQVQDDDDTVGTGCGLCGLVLPVGHRWASSLPPHGCDLFYFFFFVEIENEGKEGELMV